KELIRRGALTPKLDSQTALFHRARGRAADGLRTPVRPLRASRRNHDPGRLPPRPAGLGGLRPAMAADRVIRRPPARSPCQERHSLRGDEIRALRKLRRDYPKDAYVFVSERGGPIGPSVSTASSSASARLPRCLSRSTHTCCAMPVVLSSPMMA